jgi:hypothetical protein
MRSAGPRSVSGLRQALAKSVARESELIMRRVDPREGDERLSGKPSHESDGARHRRRSGKTPDSEKKAKKHKASDIGRALRTVYDDTLREAVPDEFSNLLGKLS